MQARGPDQRTACCGEKSDGGSGFDNSGFADTFATVSMTILTASLAASLALAAMVSGASLESIPLKDIEGKDTNLGAYRGKVLLVVNVASQCGYTRQYKPLETIYRKSKDRGLVVIGIPSNDFGGQEPGTADEIKAFCKSRFEVTFPLMEKVQVRSGAGQHPLYAYFTGKDSPFPGDVKWNFTKFLIGRDGRILARFQSADEPDSEQVTKAIEAALAAR